MKRTFFLILFAFFSVWTSAKTIKFRCLSCVTGKMVSDGTVLFEDTLEMKGKKMLYLGDAMLKIQDSKVERFYFTKYEPCVDEHQGRGVKYFAQTERDPLGQYKNLFVFFFIQDKETMFFQLVRENGKVQRYYVEKVEPKKDRD